MDQTNTNNKAINSESKPLMSSHLARNIMRLHYIQMSDQSNGVKPNSSNDGYQKKPRVCGFCKTNGESPNIYTSHCTKDKNGKTVCPILSKHVCELCGETGVNAHTRSHCPTAQHIRTDPFIRELAGGSSYFHNTVALKKTRLNSAGRVRRN